MPKLNYCAFAITLYLFFVFSAFGDEKVEIRHQLIDSSSLMDNSLVTLSLQISNHGDTDLSNVKIVPVGNTFSVSEKSRMLHIGYLPAQGTAVLQWTANTSISENYFKSGMPLFFHVVVNKGVKNTLRLPIISQGE